MKAEARRTTIKSRSLQIGRGHCIDMSLCYREILFLIRAIVTSMGASIGTSSPSFLAMSFTIPACNGRPPASIAVSKSLARCSGVSGLRFGRMRVSQFMSVSMHYSNLTVKGYSGFGSMVLVLGRPFRFGMSPITDGSGEG